ncbi:MAG: hypothetical protein V1794_04625 [Candidatus Glassbacteria bacterium]
MSKFLLVAVIITAMASIACSEDRDVWAPNSSSSGYSGENSTTNQNNNNGPSNREGTVVDGRVVTVVSGDSIASTH